ncbi:MAG TPA: YihA family ribosome biogenesis GTP-binding protein [Candidatus Faeciplasma avium]|uniref:Probable GTP-binding protein EngB n=1 Tax=Candidatus Faeciplasma avium TaxID=2840798 RepID=A0A9D1NSU4_9FIRM|nr:YihA family ribosome biogenesis GTP-binding protein [Candidatus Faeciplasma avium]
MELRDAEFKAAYGLLEQLPRPEKPEIVFAGRSNVGKSSLINKLTGRRALARVSSVPGKTQTVNFYSAKKGGVYLVDLPGYGYARVSRSEKQRWSKLINGYFSDPERDIALVLSLVDFRHPPTADDITMINFLIDCELPFVIVLTKADKLNKSEREARLEALKSELPEYDSLTLVTFSSLTGEGVEGLMGIIDEALCQE